MFNFDEFITFVKYNNVAGIANPQSELDEISLQDLRILFEAYEAAHS